MTLRFNVFGFEIAKIELDLGEDEPVSPAPLAAKGVKAMSKLWIRGMMS